MSVHDQDWTPLVYRDATSQLWKTSQVLTHKLVFEHGKLILIESSLAYRQKLPAQKLWQLLPGHGRRISKQRQVLKDKDRNLKWVVLTGWIRFWWRSGQSLPAVHWWTACCTTWWRPRHWEPDWNWRRQPPAVNWPRQSSEGNQSINFRFTGGHIKKFIVETEMTEVSYITSMLNVCPACFKTVPNRRMWSSSVTPTELWWQVTNNTLTNHQ